MSLIKLVQGTWFTAVSQCLALLRVCLLYSPTLGSLDWELLTSPSPTSLGIANSGKSLMWEGFVFVFTKVRWIIMTTLYGVSIYKCYVLFISHVKKKCAQQLVRIIVLRVKRQNLDPNFTCNLLSSSAYFRGVTKAVSRTSAGKPREGGGGNERWPRWLSGKCGARTNLQAREAMR